MTARPVLPSHSTMASHHFIGTGTTSPELASAAARPEELVRAVAALVAASGLTVVSHHLAEFPDGGTTFVWVLAESHCVLHHWAKEGFSTVDLHICDFRHSNAGNARDLVGRIEALAFVPGSAAWSELHVERPDGL